MKLDCKFKFVLIFIVLGLASSNVQHENAAHQESQANPQAVPVLHVQIPNQPFDPLENLAKQMIRICSLIKRRHF
jgi:hypothetical protein